MKNLLFVLLLTLGLFSCNDSMIENEESSTENVTFPDELNDIMNKIQTRGNWPKDAFELVEFFNNVDFTKEGYQGCETPLMDVWYGPDFEINDQYGSLAVELKEHLYTFSDMAEIVTRFWQRVANEFDTDSFVIVEVEFEVNFLLNGDPNYFIVAHVTICCDPILEPKDPKDPKTPGPAGSELGVG